MRVVFSSTFGVGHNLPMVPLATALRDAGHEVLWATSADACALVGRAGFDVVPAGLAGPALRQGIAPLHRAAREVAPPERAAFMFPRMFGALLTGPMATDLLALARDWRPDLLVHEHGELAAPLVGALLGTPSVTHSFGGAIPAPILAAGAAEVAPLWAAEGLEPPPYAGCFSSLYLDICPPSVQSVPTDHITRSQPLRPVGEEAYAPAAVDQVQDERPLVYLTLGTVQNRSPVLRPVVDAVAGLPVRLLVTVGPDGDPAVLGEQPAHVTVERWVDQATVLPRCAVVVSHAGSGTFLGSLAVGRPQLCLPQAADQFRNAAGGVRAGAALALAPDEVTAEAVRTAVTRLLREEAFRRGAGVVATEIAAMPSPAEVVDVLRGLTG